MSYNYLTYLQGAFLAALLPFAACSSNAPDTGAVGSDGTDSAGDSDGTTGGDETSTSTSGETNASGTTGDPGTSSTGSSTTGSSSGGSSGDSADDSVPGYGDDEGSCDPDNNTLLGLDLPDSNAMVSPVQARMAVLDGWGIFGDLFIRPWEFLAYYPFSYTPAPAGTLALEIELYAPKDQPEGSYELQVGVVGPWMNAALRPPLDLTLVVDISGSMKGVPLMLLKDACSSLIANLRAGDQISVVTWDSEEPVLLAHHEATGPQDPTLIALIDKLEATGGSDLYTGLSAGYALAAESYNPSRTSRVILMSDGGAAADAKTLDLIAAHASDTDEDEGIYLVGVGVGTYGGYQPALM
ncbi:MAG TPA: VWA domain-containing protein, partial [Nannocystis exedens]|nr:VWA domain-containing protein [Nannocystis exedens]